MKESLKFLVLLIFIGEFKIVRALHVDSISVYYEYYNADSSHFFLKTQVTTGDSPCWINSLQISDSINFTQVNLCYYSGGITVTCTRTDTIDLGIKKNGTVSVLAIFKEFLNGNCVSSFVYEDSFEFSINTLADINEGSYHRSYSILLSPNPAHEQQILVVHAERNFKEAAINIYDFLGRLQKTIYTGELFEGKHQFIINLSEFASGAYFYSVNANGNTRANFKIIKY